MQINIDFEVVGEHLLYPALKVLETCKHYRNCSGYSDSNHLRVGIERVIQNEKSGRRWLLKCRLSRGIKVEVRNFFKALESTRRTRMVKDVAEKVRGEVDDRSCGTQLDELAKHRELDGFAIYATDGHVHAAASHEKQIGGKIRAISHIYSLNLRSHSLAHISLTTPATGKKKEHEICTLKRIGGEALRMEEAIGVKVIHAYDPAIVDYRQWHRWKQGRGIYIITLQKSNCALKKITDMPFDAEDPRNTGILGDERIGNTKGIRLRRIRYCDPETGKIYIYITNEFSLLPGLLAFIYKLRWDVEKTFDQVKNLFEEKKAWATSDESKIQQAAFITLAHNLTLMLERTIEQREGIRDEKAEKRKAARIKKATDIVEAEKRTFNPLVAGVRRVTKRSVQFIGWLQSCLEHRTCWRDAMKQLRPLMEAYL
jgi:hypothetical protein